MSPSSLLLITAVLVGASPRTLAVQGGVPPSDEPASVRTEPTLQADASWRERVVRDQRVSFPSRAIGAAQALLRDPDAFDADRCAAWIALGAAGAVGDRSRVEHIARGGSGVNREAAVLALSGLGAGVEGALIEIAADADRAVAECALLALAVSGRESARAAVEKIARDPAHALAAEASNLLVFAADPTSSRPAHSTQLWLDLRWRAARAFGLVDGQRWSALVQRALCADAAFVREAILRAASDVSDPGVKDHLLVELVSGSGPGRLRAAVQVMPRELNDLVQYALWTPKDAGEWGTLLSEIDARALEPMCYELLVRAADVPELRYQALALCARTGRGDLAPLRAIEFWKLSSDERIWACDAMAWTGDAEWVKALTRMRTDADLDVKCAALVGLVRLDQERAKREMQEILSSVEHAEHGALVRILCRLARDPEVSFLLEDFLTQAKDDDEIAAAAALCRQGRSYARPRVRAALAHEPDATGPRVRVLVDALATHPTPEDLPVIARLFPSEDTALNVELAVALIRLREPSIAPLVRAALWGAPWDQSCLAGAVLLRVSGAQDLIDEIDRPPPEASSSDLRRVGYAIGEWGGLDAVARLARRLPAGSGHPSLQGALLGALAARTH